LRAHLLCGRVQQAQVRGSGVNQSVALQVLHAAIEGPVEAIHEAARRAAMSIKEREELSKAPTRTMIDGARAAANYLMVHRAAFRRQVI
jgi:hypothetical protein